MTLINLLLTLTIGFLLVSVLMPKKALLERLGLTFPVGIGVVTFLMFLANWLVGLRLTLAGVLFLESVLFLILLAIFLLRIKPSFTKFKIKIRPRLSLPVELILAASLIAFVGASFAIATYWPPYIFDTLSLFDFRGRVFAQEGTITGIADGYHGSFPLLTSLAHTWAYLSGAQNPKFIYPLFYLSLIIVFWSVVRRHLSFFGAMMITIILASTPIVFEHSMISYTNLPHAFYLSLGAIFLSEYLVGRKRADLIVSSLLFGLTAWVRAANEPFLVAFGILLLLFSLRGRNWNSISIFFGTFLLFEVPWKFYQRTVLGVVPYDEFNFALLLGFFNLGWTKIQPVWSLFWDSLKDTHFLGSTGWLSVSVTAVSLVLLRFFKENGAFASSILVTLVAIVVWAGISLLIGQSWGYSADWLWILGQSMKRMMIIFPPLFLYVVATSPLVKSVFPREAR